MSMVFWMIFSKNEYCYYNMYTTIYDDKELLKITYIELVNFRSNRMSKKKNRKLSEVQLHFPRSTWPCCVLEWNW